MSETTQEQVEETPEEFGQRIRAERKAQRYSMEAIAQLTGLALKTIWAAENAANKPTRSTRKAICDALGIPVDPSESEPAEAAS